jgi:exodeoxyribonuclease V alpha subunit
MTDTKQKTIVEFKGCMVRVIYTSENYKIYAFDVDFNSYPNIKRNQYYNVTVSGNLHDLEEAIEYTIQAEEKQGKYGVEYKVTNIKRDIPKTEHSVRLFLQNVLESREQVDQLMQHYPDIIDRVINNRLNDIDLKKLYNIGEYRFGVIKRRIIENFALAELINDFKGFLDFKILKALLDKYTSIENIKEKLMDNPYKCLCGISRIAFKTADKILLSFNEECMKIRAKGDKPPIDFTYDLLTSKQRQKAAIMFLLEENEGNGNTRIGIKELRKQAEALANKCIGHFVDIIKNDEHIYFDKTSMTAALQETYETEKYIANRMIEGLKIENKWAIKENDYSKFDDIQLTNEQVKTIPMVCENNISILKGGAGMGKSQSTKAVINMLKDNEKSFIIIAPTGRASKVISEFTNEYASTIHRGLAYMPPEWGFNEKNKLPYDIVIVDETSMVDIFLMRKLIEAIDFTKTKLFLVGDADQIPSVGAGNVFFDLINSGLIPMNTLTVVFRYGKGGILTVATKTRNSEKWLKDSKEPQIFGEDKGYMFIPSPQEKIISNVVALYKKLLSSGYSKEDILILSAYNKGEYGTINLNKKLQPIANPNVELDGKFMDLGETKFYEDDLVIQTVNNYKATSYNENYTWDDEGRQVFIPNGEIGKIVEIKFNNVIDKFSTDTVIYSRDDMQNVKLAYSISIHKSQGGQAKIVILLTPKAHTFMLNSNLIYVGQTRAKEKVFHFGDIDTINRSIKKKADFNRETYLKDLLKTLTEIL